jgi:hypothetical protein
MVKCTKEGKKINQNSIENDCNECLVQVGRNKCSSEHALRLDKNSIKLDVYAKMYPGRKEN